MAIRKWNLALTYQPKIESVRNGTCVQTIRTIGKSGPKSVGDLISFHGWAGKPYHSLWSWRTPYWKISSAEKILLSNSGWGQEIRDAVPWDHPVTNMIARLDGIVPPTGIELKSVLLAKNGAFPPEGVAAQVIRWEYTK